MPRMSVRGYARHRGVSHTAVQKAIRDGRITQRKDGKIDSGRADKQWAASTDHSKPRNSVTGDPKHRRRPGDPETPMGMKPRKGNGHVNGTGAPGGGDGEQLSTYAQARGEREQYQALLAKLEYERAAEKVVDAEEVKQSAYEAGRRARDILLSLPARLAPIVAALGTDADCYDAIDQAVREVCQEISGEKEPAPPRRRRRRAKK